MKQSPGPEEIYGFNLFTFSVLAGEERILLNGLKNMLNWYGNNTLIWVYLINKYVKTVQAFCGVQQSRIRRGSGCNPEIGTAGLNNDLLIWAAML